MLHRLSSRSSWTGRPWPIALGIALGCDVDRLRIILLFSTVLGASAVWAQAPPPGGSQPPKSSEAERRRKVSEQDRYKRDAYRFQSEGKLEEAKAVLEKKLALERRLPGDMRVDIVQSLSSLASIHEKLGEQDAARKAWKDVISTRPAASDLTDWRVADARRNLADLDRLNAMTADQRRRMEKARSLGKAFRELYDASKFREAFEKKREESLVRRELQGEDHPDFAANLSELAAIFQVVGSHDEAERLLRAALSIEAKALGERHPQFAADQCQLAMLYFQKGDYAQAERLLTRWAETLGRTLGEDHPEYANSLRWLADICLQRADYARCEEFGLRATAIYKDTFGEVSRGYASCLNTLAGLYRELNDYARAEPTQRAAVDAFRKAVGEGDPEYANALNNLGTIYLDLHDHARAEPALRKGLELTGKTVGVRHPEFAGRLENLGLLYLEMNDLDRAETTLAEAVARFRESVGAESPSYAHGLCSLAALFQEKNDFARAEELYREALKIQKRSMGVDHPTTLRTTVRIGRLLLESGEYTRAERLLEPTLEAIRKTWGEGGELYQMCLFYLAGSHLARGDAAGAEPIQRRALEWSAAVARDTLEVLNERQRLVILRSQRQALEAYLSVALAAKVRPADIYLQVLEWKGRAVAPRPGGRLPSDRPELRPLLEELARVRTELARMAFEPPTDPPQATWQERFDRLRERKEGLESDLASRSALRRRQRQYQNLQPGELAAGLPGGTALIDFLEYIHFSPPERAKGALQPERRLLAFVVRQDCPAELVELGQALAVDQGIAAWRRALKQGRVDALGVASLELRRRVWEPLTPHLTDARSIVIAPDGELLRFPFAALPGSKPSSYLIEDLAIGYVASGRHAVEALAPTSGPAGRGILAVGGVDFRAGPTRSTPSRRPAPPSPLVVPRGIFPQLPATGPEASRACDLFHAAFPDQPTALLTLAEPTEDKLKQRLDGGRWRVVHLATHGFFESPARIANLRSAVGHEGARGFASLSAKTDSKEVTLALAPLLHSGVVLAGAGRDPAERSSGIDVPALPDEDGILTAEEVQVLDLEGCELVVLSACDTALGTVENGQGVLGLQRAFLTAGARAVVASLWKVDDAATSVLMERFYTNLWVKKLPRLEALRQAQLDVLRNPGLVDSRRTDLAKRDLDDPDPDRRQWAEKVLWEMRVMRDIGVTSTAIHGSGHQAAPAASARSDPSLWAAFVLSGDGR
jgi:CHAT domain-containing protein/Tfp pilus assembly protein PilF